MTRTTDLNYDDIHFLEIIGKYILREQTGLTKTNRMAITRLKDHTGGKKHSTKVR